MNKQLILFFLILSIPSLYAMTSDNSGREVHVPLLFDESSDDSEHVQTTTQDTGPQETLVAEKKKRCVLRRKKLKNKNRNTQCLVL